MDDIRFYGGALLTDTEVASIYNGTEGGTPVQSASLAGRYNFDAAPEAALDLTWPLGTLESAESIDGPWTMVPNATSPYAVNAKAGGSKFFRVKF